MEASVKEASASSWCEDEGEGHITALLSADERGHVGGPTLMQEGSGEQAAPSAASHLSKSSSLQQLDVSSSVGGLVSEAEKKYAADTRYTRGTSSICPISSWDSPPAVSSSYFEESEGYLCGAGFSRVDCLTKLPMKQKDCCRLPSILWNDEEVAKDTSGPLFGDVIGPSGGSVAGETDLTRPSNVGESLSVSRNRNVILSPTSNDSTLFQRWLANEGQRCAGENTNVPSNGSLAFLNESDQQQILPHPEKTNDQPEDVMSSAAKGAFRASYAVSVEKKGFGRRCALQGGNALKPPTPSKALTFPSSTSRFNGSDSVVGTSSCSSYRDVFSAMNCSKKDTQLEGRSMSLALLTRNSGDATHGSRHETGSTTMSRTIRVLPHAEASSVLSSAGAWLAELSPLPPTLHPDLVSQGPTSFSRCTASKDQSSGNDLQPRCKVPDKDVTPENERLVAKKGSEEGEALLSSSSSSVVGPCPSSALLKRHHHIVSGCLVPHTGHSSGSVFSDVFSPCNAVQHPHITGYQGIENNDDNDDGPEDASLLRHLCSGSSKENGLETTLSCGGKNNRTLLRSAFDLSPFLFLGPPSRPKQKLTTATPVSTRLQEGSSLGDTLGELGDQKNRKCCETPVWGDGQDTYCAEGYYSCDTSSSFHFNGVASPCNHRLHSLGATVDDGICRPLSPRCSMPGKRLTSSSKQHISSCESYHLSEGGKLSELSLSSDLKACGDPAVGGSSAALDVCSASSCSSPCRVGQIGKDEEHKANEGMEGIGLRIKPYARSDGEHLVFVQCQQQVFRSLTSLMPQSSDFQDANNEDAIRQLLRQALTDRPLRSAQSTEANTTARLAAEHTEERDQTREAVETAVSGSSAVIPRTPGEPNASLTCLSNSTAEVATVGAPSGASNNMPCVGPNASSTQSPSSVDDIISEERAQMMMTRVFSPPEPKRLFPFLSSPASTNAQSQSPLGDSWNISVAGLQVPPSSRLTLTGENTRGLFAKDASPVPATQHTDSFLEKPLPSLECPKIQVTSAPLVSPSFKKASTGLERSGARPNQCVCSNGLVPSPSFSAGSTLAGASLSSCFFDTGSPDASTGFQRSATASSSLQNLDRAALAVGKTQPALGSSEYTKGSAAHHEKQQQQQQTPNHEDHARGVTRAFVSALEKCEAWDLQSPSTSTTRGIMCRGQKDCEGPSSSTLTVDLGRPLGSEDSSAAIGSSPASTIHKESETTLGNQGEQSRTVPTDGIQECAIATPPTATAVRSAYTEHALAYSMCSIPRSDDQHASQICDTRLTSYPQESHLQVSGPGDQGDSSSDQTAASFSAATTALTTSSALYSLPTWCCPTRSGPAGGVAGTGGRFKAGAGLWGEGFSCYTSGGPGGLDVEALLGRCFEPRGPKPLMQILKVLARYKVLTKNMLSSLILQFLPTIIQRVQKKIGKINKHAESYESMGFLRKALPCLTRVLVAISGDPGVCRFVAPLSAVVHHANLFRAGTLLVDFLRTFAELPFDRQSRIMTSVSDTLLPIWFDLLSSCATAGLSEEALCREVSLNDIMHPGSMCCRCLTPNIVGPRFRCEVCLYYNLCGECFIEHHMFHPANHGFQCLLRDVRNGVKSGVAPSVYSQQQRRPVYSTTPSAQIPTTRPSVVGSEFKLTPSATIAPNNTAVLGQHQQQSQQPAFSHPYIHGSLSFLEQPPQHLTFPSRPFFGSPQGVPSHGFFLPSTFSPPLGKNYRSSSLSSSSIPPSVGIGQHKASPLEPSLLRTGEPVMPFLNPAIISSAVVLTGGPGVSSTPRPMSRLHDFTADQCKISNSAYFSSMPCVLPTAGGHSVTNSSSSSSSSSQYCGTTPWPSLHQGSILPFTETDLSPLVGATLGRGPSTGMAGVLGIGTTRELGRPSNGSGSQSLPTSLNREAELSQKESGRYSCSPSKPEHAEGSRFQVFPQDESEVMLRMMASSAVSKSSVSQGKDQNHRGSLESGTNQPRQQLMNAPFITSPIYDHQESWVTTLADLAPGTSSQRTLTPPPATTATRLCVGAVATSLRRDEMHNEYQQRRPQKPFQPCGHVLTCRVPQAGNRLATRGSKEQQQLSTSSSPADTVGAKNLEVVAHSTSSNENYSQQQYQGIFKFQETIWRGVGKHNNPSGKTDR